ncbi:hypothetical protein HDU96_007199 [Phlyctochytrium bullatum]|nr:hypothetical protein HDU96_007199 [Phlyctochytrium bullatum]
MATACSAFGMNCEHVDLYEICRPNFLTSCCKTYGDDYRNESGSYPVYAVVSEISSANGMSDWMIVKSSEMTILRISNGTVFSPGRSSDDV